MVSGDFSDLNPGDETRRNGDYVGFPHGESDGTAADSVSGPVEGQPVTYNESTDEIEAAALGGSDDIAGVLFTYPYYGDSSNGPYVAGDKNATVKTSGTVVADLSAAGVDETAEGTTLGANGEIYVINVFDVDNDLAEVLVR